MLQIELVLGLDYCIETIAKRELTVVLKMLLTPRKGNKELEEKLEILRLFLERADLKQLRSESERQLMERKRVRFLVYLEEGIPKYEMHAT